MIKKNITGIVLAGGKSSRMGSDKGMVKINGDIFIAHILKAIVPHVDDVLIIANTSNYDGFGFKVYEDIIKDCGPLGGIYTGLMNSQTESNIVVSCDIPFLSADLIKHIIENSEGADIAVPIQKGNREPLCAVYKKRTTNEIYNLIMNKELKLHNVLMHFIIKEIHITKSQKFYNDKLLVNINTPKELQQQKDLV